jgi:hypothetical protein
MNVGVMKDYKLRDLRASHTLGWSNGATTLRKKKKKNISFFFAFFFLSSVLQGEEGVGNLQHWQR